MGLKLLLGLQTQKWLKLSEFFTTDTASFSFYSLVFMRLNTSSNPIFNELYVFIIRISFVKYYNP